MENIVNKIGKLSSLLTKYIGVIIIFFSVLAFFWQDGFAWTTRYTSVFLGVAMFGMGLTIHMGDFQVVFSRPKEVIIGCVAQYTVMPLVAWILAVVFHLPQDLAIGVILVGCCPGGTASNVITYIAGGDVALSVGMTIVSTLAAPLMTPLLVYGLAGAWVEVSFWAMVLSVVKVILIPVLLGILLRSSRIGCRYAPQPLRYGDRSSGRQAVESRVFPHHRNRHRSRHAEQRTCCVSGNRQLCGQSTGNTARRNLQCVA